VTIDRGAAPAAVGSAPAGPVPEPAAREPAAATTDRHVTIGADRGATARRGDSRDAGKAPRDRNETTGVDASGDRAAPVGDRNVATVSVADAVEVDRRAFAAAVTAVRTAPAGVVPEFIRTDGGGWEVWLNGTLIGGLRPAFGLRSRAGWEAISAGSLTARGQHANRRGAAVLLIDFLGRQPATTRPQDVPDATVAGWRAAGATWTQVGARVGVSARVASRRWGTEPPRSRTRPT
jgi:hypothetical protein